VAYIDTTNMPLHMPVPGTREPAQIALLNENCSVIDGHDHTTGKGIAMGRLRSGLATNRPAAGSAGNVYFSTDTGVFNVDTGTAWVQFLTSGGQATVTGWTLIDPIVRDTIQWGPEGSGTIDATLTRTAAGTLELGGGAGATRAWLSLRSPSSTGAMRLGQPVSPTQAGWMGANTDYDVAAAKWNRDDVAMNAWMLAMGEPTYQVYQAKPGANPITWISRSSIDAVGRLALAPDAGAAGLMINPGGPIAQPALPWYPTFAVVQLGASAAFLGDGADHTGIYHNSYTNAAGQPVAQRNAEGARLNFQAGGFNFQYAPSVSSGAVQTLATRLTMGSDGAMAVNGQGASYTFFSRDTGAQGFMWYAQSGNAYLYDRVKPANRISVSPAGSVNITPDTGVGGLSVNWPGIGFTVEPGTLTNDCRVRSAYGIELVANGGALRLQASSSIHVAQPVGSYLHPAVDNQTYLGHPSFRFSTIYVVTAPVVGSSADLKEDFAPLDPAACAEAVLNTDWLAYSYKAPPPPERPDGIDDEAWREQQQVYANSMLDTAASRQQKGYALGHETYKVADLFGLPDRQNRSDGSDIAVVACALQDALRRLAALEARDGNAAAA